ncbi:DUF6273 domain-containing protein [Lacrimispora sp.]|uniref:DUF6273 domain-containing protein n=1 Tax=Lacrimispora sp. TaxID=2719234 RepID=UPI0032E496F3
MKKRKSLALLSLLLSFLYNPILSYGECIQNDINGIYNESMTTGKNGWQLAADNWYYFSENGYIASGWKHISDKWYFFSPISDGTKGKMLTGWQWIDGKCYFLSPLNEGSWPQGSMYENGMTPDGYIVNESGAWVNKGGVVEIPGKGIQTVVEITSSTGRTISRGSGGGGSGGSGGSQGHSSSNNSRNENKGEKPDSKPQPAKPTDPNENGGKEVPEVPVKQYKYTIRYMDIADKTILQIMTGTENEGETIELIQPDIEGYTISKGQKETLLLTCDQITLNIYYEKDTAASPSEARKIDWDLKFIEEGKPDREIFKGQKGKTEEGRELFIDFPETIMGSDQYYYHSLVPSPWSVIVKGNGTQKYYIEYRKGDCLPEIPDSDGDMKERLNYWLDVSSEADQCITGERPSVGQLISESQAKANERLLNLVSMADGADRIEVYVIAKGYTPNAAIISQKFPAVKNVSEFLLEKLTIADEAYTILRCGFEKTYDENTCNHSYKVIDRVEPSCMDNGYETVQCLKCKKEDTVILPAMGHIDTDQNGICDVCYQPVLEIPEAVHYRVGNVQYRTIGNKTYSFRCIDEEYEDAINNSQKTALFLCDSVIRSGIMGTSKKLNFGNNNNYKYSKLRAWLHNNASDSRFLHNAYTGITRSYIGSTERGTYEQLKESSLMGYDRLFQSMEDKVFILSVEEALKYRDYLWRFNGSETNNPDSQISAYSKGYYLRTPQGGGLEDFLYGEGIYAVSLIDGNIQPVNAWETNIGIRPVMTIPQG